jgi:hypothetical protein
MELTFAAACALVESALAGGARQEIVTDLLSTPKPPGRPLTRLRDSMRANLWKTPSTQIALDRFVSRYDTRTRADGFHAIHDWNGKADAVNPDTIAVDVVNFIIDKHRKEPPDRPLVSVALDYYFMYLVAVLTLRIWDDGDADDNFDRVDRLLELLQGPGGSGHRFADDAATLLVFATSHFELDEGAYDRLLDRARTLGPRHRRALAVVHAGSLGAHLRFGFDVTYGRDMIAMRNDNGVDYRWLLFALATLMEGYADLRADGTDSSARRTLIEALVGGLSPDPAAFVDEPPRCLAESTAERSRFAELFEGHRQELIEDFEPFRPSDRAYSPLSFSFNFSHNILKGIVVDALVWRAPSQVTLNDLLRASAPGAPGGEAKKKVTATLAAYARASPDTIRGRPMPVILYDPRAGRQAFSFMMRTITKRSALNT